MNREEIEELLKRADKHLESGNTAEAWRCYLQMMKALRGILDGGIQAKLEVDQVD